MTLMELLIALALGSSLSAAIMQLFAESVHLQSVQRGVQDLQQRSAYAQFLLRAGIREAASPCMADNATLAGTGPGVEVLAAHVAVVTALPGSHVLRLLSRDCEAPVHLFYVGRRGNDQNNPAGLFRRRQRSDGTYHASEELIAGVTAMTASVAIRVPPASIPAADVAVAYVNIDQVTDWSRVFSVNLAVSLQPLSLASTGLTLSGEQSDEDLVMTFSTALRQSELRRIQ